MGCDIHAFLEVKIRGKWLLVNHPDVERNYHLFERMAGVRGDESRAIVPPRGLPKNVSPGTRLHHEWQEGDAHSMSWLEMEELKKLERWTEAHGYKWSYFTDNFGYLLGNMIYNLKEYPENYPKEIKDVRLVFWFDN